MQRITELSKLDGKYVHMALGQFDGVHVGHQALLKQCLQNARSAGQPSCVFTFASTPHPEKEQVLGKSLLSVDEKLEIFASMGFDYTLVMTFDEIRSTTKEDFLDMLVQDGRVACVYCGEDFHYGFHGQGDVAYLQAYCAVHPSLSAVVIPTVSMFGRAVSSTRIRHALLHHENRLANVLLGRDFEENGEENMEQAINKPLDLVSILNARDLGGYKTEDGRKTKRRRFLRTAATDSLTEQDREFLYGYSVRCIVDLRYTYEVTDHPSRLEGYKDIAYYNVPMLDEINSQKPEDMGKSLPDSLFDLYQGLILDSQASFKRVLDIIADHPKDCILFNCTAGKDRTGLTAMLLLSIAQVPESVIVQDYAVSEEYLTVFIQKKAKELEAAGVHAPKFMFGTAPENMERTLSFIKERFTTVHDYLLQIGVGQDQIEKIRKSMIE